MDLAKPLDVRFARPDRRGGAGELQHEMKVGKRDPGESKLLEWKGGVKKKAGPVLAYSSLKVEGRAEPAGGRWQQRVGQIKKLLGK